MGFRGLTFKKSLAAFSGERVYSQAEFDAVVAAEREACAKVADAELRNTMSLMSYPAKSSAAWNIANTIRARTP